MKNKYSVNSYNTMHHGAEMKISRQKIRRMILERMALREHRTMPDASAIPPQHLDTIHDIIDRGDLAQAQSLVGAFGGPPNYVQDYLEYQNVGDMEKLGNRAYDARSTYDPDSLELTSTLKDIDREAIGIADKRGRRLDGDNHSYLFPGSFQTDVQRYLANRDRPLSEHRIAPSLNLPGVPQSHIDKIHDLISSGELEMAQSLIDAFGGPPNYTRDYQMYDEVGDLEKLGNRAADVMSRVPKTERGWSTMSDMQPVYDVDKQAYDSVNRKIERGELPADTTWDRDYMRDRYFNIRNNTLPHTFVDHREDKSPTYFDDDGNPLNEHNSSRAGLRRMILQEMSSMGVGGQPPMSIDAMMQELQSIEAQLEEMELERQDYLMSQERYGVDPIEAAYGYEMEYPDYYDDKEELQSRAYELEEMIEDAGGPTL